MDRETPTYAGLILSFIKYRDRLIARRGFKLNSKPREIDVRIIDKLSGEEPIDNDIARIFERHNLIELKNPYEPLNIDVLWKGISYAAQYKSMGRDDFENRQGINIIPMKDITLTFLRMSRPKALFEEMKSLNYRLEEKYPGVYYVYYMADIKMQIVVGRELKGDDFVPLRVQNKNADIDDATKFAELAKTIDGVSDKELADAIFQLSITENESLYEKLRKERPEVCEAMRLFFKDELEERYRLGATDGYKSGSADGYKTGSADGYKLSAINIARNMIKRGYSNEEIATLTALPLTEIKAQRFSENP